jgi:hypothetical protein
MKKYLVRSIVTGLVFVGLTLAFDAIFNEVSGWQKYVISGVLFGFVYEGWWYLYQKGVFSQKREASKSKDE